jgi:hypothetical protein
MTRIPEGVWRDILAFVPRDRLASSPTAALIHQMKATGYFEDAAAHYAMGQCGVAAQAIVDRYKVGWSCQTQHGKVRCVAQYGTLIRYYAWVAGGGRDRGEMYECRPVRVVEIPARCYPGKHIVLRSLQQLLPMLNTPPPPSAHQLGTRVHEVLCTWLQDAPVPKNIRNLLEHRIMTAHADTLTVMRRVSRLDYDLDAGMLTWMHRADYRSFMFHEALAERSSISSWS